MKPVYKILKSCEWADFNKNGFFMGSQADFKDGFIHLASGSQIKNVIEKYFLKERPLFVIKFSEEDFLKKLTWEFSSSGENFPHLYNTKILLDDMNSYEIKN